MKTTSIVTLTSAVALSLPAVAQRLIAVDSAPGAITVYEIDQNTAARTALGSLTPAAAVAAGLAYDALGGRLFLSGAGTDSLYLVDVTNWQAQLIGAYGSSAINMQGLEWDGSVGVLYGMSTHNSGLYTIDTATGVATLVGVTGLTPSLSVGLNLCHDALNDILYLTSIGTDSLYTIDRATGAATLVGPMTGTTNVNALAFRPAPAAAFGIDNLQDQLYRIDLQTGAPTPVGSVGTSNMIGLAYIDGAGRLSRQAHACGPTTITPIGNPGLGGSVTFTVGAVTGFPFVGFGFTPLAVPFCGCTVGHEWAVAATGPAVTLSIPAVPALVGSQVHAQGLDLFGTGGCADPLLTVTDTITLTIG